MDIIYADGQPLFVPGTSSYTAYDIKLTRKLNRSGSMDFTLPPGHHLYDSLIPLKSEVVVYRDSKVLWSGRIINVTRDFFRCKTFSCEGELSYLNDTSYAPNSFSGSITTYLTKLLANHNAQMYTNGNKMYQLGKVDVEGTVIYEQADPETTWELINENLIDTFGGYLAIRNEDGVKYLDYLTSSGNVCGQVIECGRNLIDLEEYTDASELFTVLVPMAKDEDGNYFGIGTDGAYYDSGDGVEYYVKNDAAVEYYGRIVKVEVFDDIKSVDELRAAAEARLAEAVKLAVTITADAVDLVNCGIDTDRITLGSLVRIISAKHGLDAYFVCSEITESIGEPERTQYTLGTSLTSMTARQLAAGKRTKVAKGAAVSAASAITGLPKTLSGSVTTTIPSAGTYRTEVTFSKAFSSVPNVLLMPQKSGLTYSIVSITTAGFKYDTYSATAQTAVFSWIATE